MICSTESCDIGALSSSSLPDILTHLLKESNEERVDVTEEVLELISDLLLETGEGVYMHGMRYFRL